MASMRNMAGEVLGSMAAIEKAVELGLEELSFITIIWESKCGQRGLWKRNKKETIAYYDYVQSVKSDYAAFYQSKRTFGVAETKADRRKTNGSGII